MDLPNKKLCFALSIAMSVVSSLILSSYKKKKEKELREMDEKYLAELDKMYASFYRDMIGRAEVDFSNIKLES